MTPTKTQKSQVVVGILVAWALSAVFIVSGVKICVHFDILFDTPTEATAFAIATAAVALILGIGLAAKTRHFVSNIDGSPPIAGSTLDLTLRYVTNTTEQLVLFTIACLCVFYVDENVATKLLPVIGIWFLVARALFWVGYRITPLARSVGFAATFHPTIALFVFVFVRLMT
jgi:hypothetical protein